jgi:hypothetical protein
MERLILPWLLLSPPNTRYKHWDLSLSLCLTNNADSTLTLNPPPTPNAVSARHLVTTKICAEQNHLSVQFVQTPTSPTITNVLPAKEVQNAPTHHSAVLTADKPTKHTITHAPPAPNPSKSKFPQLSRKDSWRSDTLLPSTYLLVLCFIFGPAILKGERCEFDGQNSRVVGIEPGSALVYR